MSSRSLTASRRRTGKARWRIAPVLAVAVGACLAPLAADSRAAFVNGRIMFIHGGPDFPGDVFSINPDGSDATNLTRHPANDGVGNWAFGGARIAFTSSRDDDDPEFGPGDIFVMNADGSRPINITHHPSDDSTPAWSPDNGQIAFDSDRAEGNRDVYVITAGGSDSRRATRRLTTHRALDAYPYFSPDGKKLTFTSYRDGNDEIYVMNADGTGPETNLTQSPGTLDTAANYSPDGAKIAYMSKAVDEENKDSDDWDIWVMNANGSEKVNLTADSPFDDGNPNWSPDGAMITSQSNRDGDNEIFIMNANGSNPRQVTNNIGDDSLPDWARIAPSPVTAQARPSPTKPLAVQDECASLLRRPRVSVTHWRRLAGRSFARLKVAPGGYVIRPDRKTRFMLQTQRRARRPGSPVRRVEFSLDGKRVAVDHKSPFEVTLKPGSLSTGQHALSARVRTAGGKQKRIKLIFVAANCETAAFSASMINKQPGKSSDLELRAQTGGPKLTAAEFTLSPRLRISTRGLSGKRIGSVELANAAGRLVKKTLVLPRRKRRALNLVAGGKPQLALKRADTRASLTLTDLGDFDATNVRIVLFGRRTGLLRNPRSCLRHRYGATLRTQRGKLTLRRTLQMCKGRPRR